MEVRLAEAARGVVVPVDREGKRWKRTGWKRPRTFVYPGHIFHHWRWTAMVGGGGWWWVVGGGEWWMAGGGRRVGGWRVGGGR